MSNFRDKFWPIYGKNENKKFISLALMLCLALFSYTCLRITKDALMITSNHSGAAVINFLKGYIIMPCSILFVIFYSKMSNLFSREKLFYVTLTPFIIFFIVFLFVLYPLSGYLHMDSDKILALQMAYPRLKYVFPIFGYWVFSCFFVFAELWGNVAITLLFWQFANSICSSQEARRFYPLLGSYSYVGVIIGGYVQASSVSTELTSYLIICSGIAMCLVYMYLNRDPQIIISSDSTKKGPRLSLKESFKLIASSKYLAYIAMIILAYSMTANLIEVTWKMKVKELYSTKTELQTFMGKFYFITGFSTIFVGIVGKYLLTRFNWIQVALITPCVLFITSFVFFSFTLYSQYIFHILHIQSTIIGLSIAVFSGAIQNVASKSCKYALLDPTTQMTYIPLDRELREKGKAAVDVLAIKTGKSLGGYIQSLALIITGGTQLTIAPILMIIAMFVLSVWIFSIVQLNKEYSQKLASAQRG